MNKSRCKCPLCAASTMTSRVLRENCFAAIRERDLTADEVANAVSRCVLSVRPRVSELKRAGKISKTNKRRPNASGHFAAVWAATK